MISWTYILNKDVVWSIILFNDYCNKLIYFTDIFIYLFIYFLEMYLHVASQVVCYCRKKPAQINELVTVFMNCVWINTKPKTMGVRPFWKWGFKYTGNKQSYISFTVHRTVFIRCIKMHKTAFILWACHNLSFLLNIIMVWNSTD